MAKYKEITLVLEITPEMLLRTGADHNNTSPGSADDAGNGAEEPPGR